MTRLCASISVLFTVAATILLVFGEVRRPFCSFLSSLSSRFSSQISQINSDLIPRHLRIVSIDTSGVGVALAAQAKSAGLTALASNNFSEIYNNGEGEYYVKGANETRNDGLRKVYVWGLWCTSSSSASFPFLAHDFFHFSAYCTTNGDLGSPRSYCLSRSISGPRFHPAQVLLSDIPSTFSALLRDVLPSSVLEADTTLSTYTRGATYSLLVGDLCAALAAAIALFAKQGAFVLGTLLAVISFCGLAAGSAVWTVVVWKAEEAIGEAAKKGTDVGITVSYGNGLVRFFPLPFSCPLFPFAPPLIKPGGSGH
jgi:hypothetical protein